MKATRKICRECRQAVTIQEGPQVARLRKEQGLRDDHWPKGAVLLFRCPTHGYLEWHAVTHGEAA